MEEEIWKDIEGYERYYQVSSLGRIRSLDRVVICKNGKTKFNKGRVLKPNVRKYGYLQVRLRKTTSESDKWLLVHRLVANAFLPNPNNLPQINHKDENPQNNNVDNLEWCDHKYNINYGTRTERATKKLSKRVYQYTLDGKLVNIWQSIHEAGRGVSGCDYRHISDCCRGNIRKHMGFLWSYTPLEAPND